MADRLVDLTDKVLTEIKYIKDRFNKVFDHVCIKLFNYGDTNYELVCVKEIMEIREMFRMFHIRIKPLEY